MDAYTFLKEKTKSVQGFTIQLLTSDIELEGNYQKCICQFIVNGEPYYQNVFDYHIKSITGREYAVQQAWDRILFSMVMDAVLYRPKIIKWLQQEMVDVGHPLAQKKEG